MAFNYSIVIGPKDALPQAFVVFRGFEDFLENISQLGYSGIELAIRKAGDIDATQLSRQLEMYNLTVSAISTGQVFAETGLSFTDSDRENRKKLFAIFKKIIDLAEQFGNKVNIGRVRGFLNEKNRILSFNYFAEAIGELCSYAADKKVDILLEPVNRYELNFINNLDQAMEIISKLQIPNLFLMPDLFHMNIEDADIEQSLEKNSDKIRYIHFADSNRQAPGFGHLDFKKTINCLKKINYKGWITLEIFPEPDAKTAAKQSIDFLKNIEKTI